MTEKRKKDFEEELPFIIESIVKGETLIVMASIYNVDFNWSEKKLLKYIEALPDYQKDKYISSICKNDKCGNISILRYAKRIAVTMYTKKEMMAFLGINEDVYDQATKYIAACSYLKSLAFKNYRVNCELKYVKKSKFPQ